MPYKNPQDPRVKATRLRHYYKNKERYIANNKKRWAVLTDYINEQKKAPCTDCGNVFPPVAMDFDHLRDKDINVSRLYRYGSLKRIQEEIAKCELVCSNCHRVRTQNRLTKRSAGISIKERVAE